MNNTTNTANEETYEQRMERAAAKRQAARDEAHRRYHAHRARVDAATAVVKAAGRI
jgi:hypothetical protein